MKRDNNSSTSGNSVQQDEVKLKFRVWDSVNSYWWEGSNINVNPYGEIFYKEGNAPWKLDTTGRFKIELLGTVKYLQQLATDTETRSVLRAKLHQANDKIRELEQWKEEAIEVMPDFHEIGRLLNIPLGHNVSKNIIPYIKNLKGLLKKALNKNT